MGKPTLQTDMNAQRPAFRRHRAESFMLLGPSAVDLTFVEGMIPYHSATNAQGLKGYKLPSAPGNTSRFRRSASLSYPHVTIGPHDCRLRLRRHSRIARLIFHLNNQKARRT